jgi:hypothetical protein
MSDEVEFVASGDTLGREVQTECTLDAPVLGIPVRYESNSPTVIAIAESVFGQWRTLDRSPELIAAQGALIRVMVVDGDEGNVEHAPFRYHVPDADRVIVTTRGSVGLADGRRREGVIYATPALVRDREHFRYNMLEAVTLSVLSRQDRTPFHAAALMRGDTALLLAAPSGLGKSTLAYAGARAGLKVLAEDLVFLQRRPLRVWGWPGALHLPADAAAHFPELVENGPMLLANGKKKIALRTRTLDALPAVPVARRAGICLLRRENSGAVSENLDGRTLIGELTRASEDGFDIFDDIIDEVLAPICRHGGWILNVAGPPAQLVPELFAMLDALDSRAPSLSSALA